MIEVSAAVELLERAVHALDQVAVTVRRHVDDPRRRRNPLDGDDPVTRVRHRAGRTGTASRPFAAALLGDEREPLPATAVSTRPRDHFMSPNGPPRLRPTNVGFGTAGSGALGSALSRTWARSGGALSAQAESMAQPATRIASVAVRTRPMPAISVQLQDEVVELGADADDHLADEVNQLPAIGEIAPAPRAPAARKIVLSSGSTSTANRPGGISAVVRGALHSGPTAPGPGPR